MPQSINSSVNHLGDKCKDILGMYALSGCDTLSYPNGKVKLSALKIRMQNYIVVIDSIMGEEGATIYE